MAQNSGSSRRRINWSRMAVLAIVVVLFIGIIVWISNLGIKQGLMEEDLDKFANELSDLNSRFKKLTTEQEVSIRKINEIASELANIPSIIQKEV
jgi:predicted PurR-regulated permease PerM